MKNKVCNRKTNKATKKNKKNCINQNNSSSSKACTRLKFVGFTSTLNLIIQRNL